MAARPLTRQRLIRAGLVLLAGWLLLEFALVNLVAARLGWGLTLICLALKGGLGLLLIGALALRGMRRIRASLLDRSPGGGTRAAFGVLGAVLIALPGFVPALIGIALFSPSLQALALKLLRARGGLKDPRVIELSPGDWREVRRRKLAARARLRKASLEAKPPAV